MAVANPISAPKSGKGAFRRDFLKMQSLLLASMFVPSAAPAATDAETPVQRAFNKWRAAYQAAESAPCETDDDTLSALYSEAARLSNEVVEAETQTPGDTIFKLVAYTFFGDHEPCDGPLGHLIYQEANSWVEAAR